MTTARTTFLAGFVALLVTTACRNQLPCPDCDEEVDDEDDEKADDQADLPLPDLPCGGADLLTDNLNCGSCGHECILWHPDTPYVAGTCIEGGCGPGWTGCWPEGLDPFQDCSEVCTALGQNCVPNGCAGYTGMMFEVDFDGWGCDPKTSAPVVTMTGDCEEPIPWTSDSELMREVMCCCDFQ